MKNRFFHDERKNKLQDGLIYVNYMFYLTLLFIKPQNLTYRVRLNKIKKRINELKSLKSINQIAN